MALTEMGLPFKGTAWYWQEDSYGSGNGAAVPELPISSRVQNVRVDTGDRHKVLRDIGSPLACKLLKQTHEPKLHLEYIPQTDDTLITDSVNRDACGVLQSVAFCIGLNTCLASADNKTYIYAIGCKPSTTRISSSKNTEYLIVIDYEVKQITPSGVVTGTAPAALTGADCQFNVAGEIKKTGGHIVNVDHIAFCTNSIDITVNHKLTGYTDHDSLYKDYLVEGEMDIEGSVDISLDGGGASHISEVLANTSFTLVIDLADSPGAPRITLEDCEWKSGSVDANVGGEGIFDSAPFTAKPAGMTIVTQIPVP